MTNFTLAEAQKNPERVQYRNVDEKATWGVLSDGSLVSRDSFGVMWQHYWNGRVKQMEESNHDLVLAPLTKRMRVCVYQFGHCTADCVHAELHSAATKCHAELALKESGVRLVHTAEFDWPQEER